MTPYAMIGILIPMYGAVGDVIEEGIRECNKMSEFLFVHYYVTNVKKPTQEEISKYLEEISQGEKKITKFSPFIAVIANPDPRVRWQ